MHYILNWGAVIAGFMPVHPLTAVGLVLGMIGGMMIFVWGPPQPSFPDHVGLSLEDNTPMGDGKTVKDLVDDEQRKRQKYANMSKAGLVLIIIGFAVQLIDAWIN
jgi:hypothetical protein